MVRRDRIQCQIVPEHTQISAYIDEISRERIRSIGVGVLGYGAIVGRGVISRFEMFRDGLTAITYADGSTEISHADGDDWITDAILSAQHGYSDQKPLPGCPADGEVEGYCCGFDNRDTAARWKPNPVIGCGRVGPRADRPHLLETCDLWEGHEGVPCSWEETEVSWSW